MRPNLKKTILPDLSDFITTLSGGLLVTNWLVGEQQMLRDVGFSVFADSIQNPRNQLRRRFLLLGLSRELNGIDFSIVLSERKDAKRKS